MANENNAPIKPPTIAELQERIDQHLKEVLEKAAGRPFTEGTVDDVRLDLESRGLKVVDMTRYHSHVDERVYSRACYELNYYRMATVYLVKVCKENGFDFTLDALAAPVDPITHRQNPVTS